MFVYHNPHIIKDIVTIVASNTILTVENLQFVTIAIASTHPSPGSGAILVGIYTNIPNASKTILSAKNKTSIRTDPSNGMDDTKYSAKSVKYPNKTQLINCNNLLFSNLDRKIRN